MGVLTLLRFLVGDRDAILRIAGDRNALWIGFVFVLSAGFAREYDGEDLLAEPWHLLIPLGASLVASFLLFLFVQCDYRDPRISFWAAYASFLGLFWMTAPLAWVYAIPYERFMGYEAAVDANVYTLGLVAAWRVALTVRLLVVCTDMRLLGAAGVVWLFCTLAASVGVVVHLVSDASLLDMMGGLRAGDEELNRGQRWTLFVSGLVCLAFWPTLLLASVLAFTGRGTRGWLVRQEPSPCPTLPALLLAAVSLLVWVPILPVPQREQQRRRAVETALRARSYSEAAAVLREYPREAFPPHWLPPAPPRPSWEQGSEIVGMLRAFRDGGGAGWAEALYWQRFESWLDHGGPEDTELKGLAEFLPLTSRGRELLEEARRSAPRADDPRGEWGGTNRQRSLWEILKIVDANKER